MAAKSAINTPFQERIGEKIPGKHGNPGIYEKNRAPDFSKPHSMGANTIPLKFYEGGKALEPNPEKFETPFNNTLYAAGSKKIGSTYQTPGKK